LKSDLADDGTNFTGAAGFATVTLGAGTPSSVAAAEGATASPFGTGSGGTDDTDSEAVPAEDDADA
jgi:hypothetical protein